MYLLSNAFTASLLLMTMYGNGLHELIDLWNDYLLVALYLSTLWILELLFTNATQQPGSMLNAQGRLLT